MTGPRRARHERPWELGRAPASGCRSGRPDSARLLGRHHRELIAYGAGWTDPERQQPVGDTGRNEPRQIDVLIEAELERAIADPDPLRGIAQLTARWAAAFVLNPLAVTRTKALGSERMERKLRDALPGGEGALRSGSNLPTVTMMVGGIDKQIYLPYQLAQNLGFYKKYGVNMQLSTEQSGGVGAETAMASGQVDMAGAWYVHNRDLKRLQNTGGRAPFFAQQPEQDVLGADVVVAQRPGLFLSQDDHLAGALGKSLKHTPKVPTFGR